MIRIPIVPGSDPRKMYGDLVDRGVRGIVLEAFGVGNMPDTASSGWLPWLRQQRKKASIAASHPWRSTAAGGHRLWALPSP